MSRSLETEFQDAIEAPVAKYAFFFEVDLPSGTWRGWTGYNQVTFKGETWDPVPGLLEVEGYEESVDSAAKGVSFTFLVQDATKMADVYSGAYWGRAAKIWLASLDSVGLPEAWFPWFVGNIDTDTVEADGEQRIVKFDLEHRLSDLLRKRVWRYTPEDQKLLYPGTTDKGLDFAASVEDVELPWGQ